MSFSSVIMDLDMSEGEESAESVEGACEAASTGARAQCQEASEDDAEMHASFGPSSGQCARPADEALSRRRCWMQQHKVFSQL